jgi:hypothetical protein
MKSLHLAPLALLVAAAAAQTATAQETPPKPIPIKSAKPVPVPVPGEVTVDNPGGIDTPQGKPVAKPAGKPAAAPAAKPANPQDGKTPDAAGQSEAPPQVDPVTLLKNSLDLARRENAYLELVKRNGGLLNRFRRSRTEASEMRNKFTPETIGPVMPKQKQARLLGDAEKAALGAEVVFTVESVPVTKVEFDAMVEYLGSYPKQDSTADIKTLAIASLVRAKAGLAVFSDRAKKARVEIDALAKELGAGANFSALAKAHSEDQATAAKGGKRDYLVRADADANYARAAFSLNVGQVSDVVTTPAGYHLIRVLGKKKGATADQDRVLTSHILKRFADDDSGLTRRLADGALDVAFRSDDLRKLAPTVYK